MAEAIVSSVLEQLISISSEEVRLVVGVKKEVKKLTNNLKAIQGVLVDAEQKQLKEAQVGAWLDQLKDTSYDMEDVLDEWKIARMKLQMDKAENGLVIPKKKKALISKLCESNEQQEGPHVISIVGMGGIGKTTLAQLAYNDDEVKKVFDKIIWVCVSDPFDEFRIAKAIIEAFERSNPNLGQFQSLLEQINASILRKKFLLVLDDVWTEDHNKWEPFKNCLKNGLHGSKILVTTRKETVAKMMNSVDIINIKELSYNECRLLFKKLAFSGRSPLECEKLEEIGRKVVHKCKGLPLAAKAIGSLLCFKKNKEEWQSILDSELWKLEEFEKGICPPLLLSYNDLPSKIKSCFSYCAVFVKDSIIDKDELIKLWMAEGYLVAEGNKEMEIVGDGYFDYLATRSFFQEFNTDSNGNVYSCKMHDIVHDLAQFVSRNECASIEICDPDSSLTSTSFDKVRHSTLVLKRDTSFPVSIFSAQKLRSLFIHVWSGRCQGKVFDSLTCLRALSISGSLSFLEISKGIEKLIHLRYLCLHYRNIKELPEACCGLYNLQTLDIRECYELKTLPERVHKLVNLRHLLLEIYQLHYMPKGIERLTGLRSLAEFVVSGDGQYGGKACNIGSLKHLNHLRGSLQIRGLGNVIDVEEARKAELEKKKNLSSLTLLFTPTRESEIEVDNEAIIEALTPTPKLEELEILSYRGKMLPNWLMSLTNLKNLSLKDCHNCESVPFLGKFPFLECIFISLMESVKRVGYEFLGIKSDHVTSSSSSSPVIAFPKLKFLNFSNRHEWEEWDFGITSSGKEDIIIMPHLNHLRITDCPKLKALPDHLLQSTTLKTISIIRCPILEEDGNFFRRKHFRE
ncbi:Disease resistance protein [Melia azedarach]|uniref:Disease resistance protein n=1 Tax=Melia azedarach TaxID=155640 RepID=A0ACC1Y7H2_MELAZ|nr:Disease resistance protein [Melia azedarach]